ncbi:LeuA family protein [Halobaculum sp. EA56]|uniref:LeuA family protein n=1 Tax=Halobaculum sp. EA56 TaxID=3421648 RepID=UPI003EB96E19
MRLSDVTLREGDQMPGREFTAADKVECARVLDDLGVPYIQPAFPATGEKDRRVLRELAGTTDADIVALARALEGDVDAAVDAGADVVETFVPVSDLQLTHLLGTTREDMLSMVGGAVDHARDRGARVHVTLADAFRTDTDDLIEVIERVPEAECVTLADTVGARTPASVLDRLDRIDGHVKRSRVGVHFHDDLGCATANALAAARAGVGKADVSVGGLGERAGNSPLEEVVVAAAVDTGAELGIETDGLIPACRDVLDTLGEGYDERKPVLGAGVSEHESGIHTAAMLSEPAAMEAYDPGRFGGERRLIFGTQTGVGAARQLLERAGHDPDETAVDTLLDRLAAEGPLSREEAIALAAEVGERPS